MVPENPKGTIVTTGLGFFPKAYKFEINGKESDYNNCGGRVCFDVKSVKEGENYISWKIVQTPTESFFNYVTLAFLVLWLILLVGGKKLKPYLLLIAILTVFLFFRSYNLSGRIGFGWDQERDANAVAHILSGDFTLLGPRVQGPDGFFLPPYFFYLLAPFYQIMNLSSYAMNVFLVSWAILTFFIGYFVFTKIFDRKMAIIFLALWAVNPLAVSIDTISWNPVVIPFLVLLLIYLLYLFYKNKKSKFLFLIGFIFGFGVSFHLQFLFVFPMLIPVAYEIIKNKRFKDLVYLLVGMIIPFLPILLFDLRHNFLNLKQIIEFTQNTQAINRVLPVWERASSFMVGGVASRALGLAIYLLGSIGFFILAVKLKDKVQRKIFLGLGTTWAASLFLFYLFIKNPSEYYFNYLLVPALILVAYTLKSWRRIGIIILFGLVIYFSYQARPLLRSVNLSLREKDHVVGVLAKMTKNSDPFNVSFDVPLNEDTGFRYLLNYYKVPVSGKEEDPLIEFVIPAEARKDIFMVGKIGLYIPSGWISHNWIR